MSATTEFQTEVEFALPRGLPGPDGALHREGVMRLATAADEILPLRDPRVQSNPAYLSVIVLSRVVRRIGGISDVTPKVIENLYASDLAYLQTLYQDLNGDGRVVAQAECPKCEHAFEVRFGEVGEA
ncbi:MAG: phage tail assembly protein [Planctomycetes bacterium]|nr:phage tail assembly protein [Planctomycetota bacterium]